METLLHRLTLCILAASLLAGGCTATTSSTGTSGYAAGAKTNSQGANYTTLSQLTDAFAGELAAQTQASRVYLDRAKIRDVNTGDVARFSLYLQEELESSLSKEFQLQVLPQEAELILGATFQVYGDTVRIFFKYRSAAFGVNRSSDYTIDKNYLPKGIEKGNLHSKAYQLASAIIESEEPSQLYVKPFESIDSKAVSPFSRAFTALVRDEIVRVHRQVAVIDDNPLQDKLSNTRALQQQATEVKNIHSADAYYAEADTVLEGEYFVNGDNVIVSLRLEDLQGHILNSAKVDIARSLITMPLSDREAETISMIADRKSEQNEREKAVKVSTNKGGAYPVYHEGERIVFHAQVNTPLYLYIYDISSTGGVELLYPIPGETHRPTYPGSLVAIPDPASGSEFSIQPPFGKDVVKVFASPVELPLPVLSREVPTRSFATGVRAIGIKQKQIQSELSGSSRINPKDLVDYYKGLADRFNITIHEDSLLLETRG